MALTIIKVNYEHQLIGCPSTVHIKPHQGYIQRIMWRYTKIRVSFTRDGPQQLPPRPPPLHSHPSSWEWHRFYCTRGKMYSRSFLQFHFQSKQAQPASQPAAPVLIPMCIYAVIAVRVGASQEHVTSYIYVASQIRYRYIHSANNCLML